MFKTQGCDPPANQGFPTSLPDHDQPGVGSGGNNLGKSGQGVFMIFYRLKTGDHHRQRCLQIKTETDRIVQSLKIDLSGQLMGMDLPEQLYAWLGDPLWDSSAWLDDGSRLGGLIAGLTGYRAMPSAAAALLLAGFWLLAWYWRRAPRQCVA